MEHETLFFHTVRFEPKFIEITAEHYENCPDFKGRYKTTVQGKLRRREQKSTRKRNRGRQQMLTTPVADESHDPEAANYSIHHGILYFHSAKGTDRICVPDNTPEDGAPTLRQRFISEMHNSIVAVHLGVSRTTYEVRRRAFWPHLERDISRYIAACEACQRNKKSRQKPSGFLQRLQVPTRPGTHYGLDFLSGLPSSSKEEYDCIMVVVDRYSKRVWAIPTWKTADARMAVEQFIKHIVYENGVPIELVSDRDTRFTPTNAKSKAEGFWRQFWNYLGTSICLATARHQSTDGQAERAIAQLTEMMRMGIDCQQTNWASLLPRICFTINNSVAKATGVSPFFLEKGRHPLVPLDRQKIVRTESDAPVV